MKKLYEILFYAYMFLGIVIITSFVVGIFVYLLN